MQPLHILRGALAQFFRYNKYEIALTELRQYLLTDVTYRTQWPAVVEAIFNHRFAEGEALKAMIEAANLPLYVDTEAEAYRWLCLMALNSVASADFPVIPYTERV
jgi:hypothetical protein